MRKKHLAEVVDYKGEVLEDVEEKIPRGQEGELKECPGCDRGCVWARHQRMMKLHREDVGEWQVMS